MTSRISPTKLWTLTKNLSAFYERLLLVDVGTIGLSVTALTSFLPRASGAYFPRGTFLWIVAPAWILVLLSIFFVGL